MYIARLVKCKIRSSPLEHYTVCSDDTVHLIIKIQHYILGITSRLKNGKKNEILSTHTHTNPNRAIYNTILAHKAEDASQTEDRYMFRR